jgi:hypothetical protein
LAQAGVEGEMVEGAIKVMHGSALAGGEGGSSTNSKEMLKPPLQQVILPLLLPLPYHRQTLRPWRYL